MQTGTTTAATTKPPHAALLVSPGIGHLIPVLELGKRLVALHGFHVTVFVVSTNTSPAESQLLKPSEHVDIVLLPAVDLSGKVGPATSLMGRLAIMVRESLPALWSAISAMEVRPAALIVDLFGTEALAVARELKMLMYVFMLCNAWSLAYTLHVPSLDRKMEDEHVVDRKPLCIPGCKPVQFEDTIESILCRDRDYQRFSEYFRMGVEMPYADGILVNTWQDLEPDTLKALGDERYLGRITKAPVYPIGPLVRAAEPGLRDKVLDWLDMQPGESVIYVSFGSGGTMSAEQTMELAWGLELSQQRFVWVVRPPTENDAAARFFTAGAGKRSDDDTPGYLPDGFLTRTKRFGLVVTIWASQPEILAHPSVGGFLSHCGWNSTVESLVNGVPMIAWPLFAEQKMNATMLAEEVGVAVKPEELPTKKVVRREEIERMVRDIMEEKSEMRSKAKELQHSAEKALKKGGSSYKSLCHVAKECKTSIHRKCQGP